MRITAPLSLLLFLAANMPAQDHALQLDGRLGDASIHFGWENIMATGTEFTAEARVRANTWCTNPGDFDVFSRFETRPGGEQKRLTIHADGSISAIYRGSVDQWVTTAPGAFPRDQDWHHVRFVHDAANNWKILVDGTVHASGTGNGFPIAFSAGLDTVIGHGNGYQITNLRVSDVARQNNASGNSFSGDSNAILLLHFEEGSGTEVHHDNVTGFPRTMVGTIHGQGWWVTGEGGDFDDDGRTDNQELADATNVFDKDSDDDGLSDGEENTNGTNPLSIDSDGDNIQDGTELSHSYGDEEIGNDDICYGGTDLNVFMQDQDTSDSTDPLDQDTDDDGLSDDQEDLNLDGEWKRSQGETDAANVDSDRDDLWDGLEVGMGAPVNPDTDPHVFQADQDPSTQTDPLKKDTDNGGLDDGKEDINHNGAVDGVFETDNLWSTDDYWELTVHPSTLQINQFAYLNCDRCFNGSSVVMMYSFAGYGATYFGIIEATVALAPPVQRLPNDYAYMNDALLIRERLPNDPALSGERLFLQGVELCDEPGQGMRYRLSNPEDALIQ
ncbi:MAG: hypothetical protein QGH51_02335 [Planctomycetota bacterium]|jgi:hypothetical protein|nr:hypothetical protein [Planctomycetota bacterium]MDP6940841.1 hypothetical protein [Planctomycetota bacterium]